MSTIPKERLEQLASGNAWYCVQDDEAAELARIALASLEAEPYGYVHKAAYEKTGSCGLSNDREAYRYSSTHVAVYTAPPAPVSVPAAMEMDDDFDSAFEHGKAVGWNACRAAMLYGAVHASQAYKLPQTQFKQVADLYEMQFDDGRTCTFHTDAQKAVQWLQACDGNRVQEYVKLERLQNALSGNSPVTPDGWISCSERMPKGYADVLVTDGEHVEVKWWDESGYWNSWTELNSDIFADEITHWMPLPEPPQEVNRG